MKIIVISGPSGSGKSCLSNKLSKLFDNSIIVKTESYYRDDLYIKLLSIFIYDIYDRFISIKDKCLIKTIKSIYNKEKYATFYKYDFRSKRSSHSKEQIQYENNKRFLILEGIFAHRLDLNYEKTINILCNVKKEICYERRLQRDKIERGRNLEEVNNKFSKSWDIYYKNITRFLNTNKIVSINTVDENSYNKLISILKELSLKKNQEK